MNISEKPQWENNISMLARQQKVEGGRDGAANIQAQQLANRTQYLKEQLDAYNNMIKSGELPFSDLATAQAAIDAGKIPLDAPFSYRSDSDEIWAIEGKNVAGTATPVVDKDGKLKAYPTAKAVETAAVVVREVDDRTSEVLRVPRMFDEEGLRIVGGFLDKEGHSPVYGNENGDVGVANLKVKIITDDLALAAFHSRDMTTEFFRLSKNGGVIIGNVEIFQIPGPAGIVWTDKNYIPYAADPKFAASSGQDIPAMGGGVTPVAKSVRIRMCDSMGVRSDGQSLSLGLATNLINNHALSIIQRYANKGFGKNNNSDTTDTDTMVPLVEKDYTPVEGTYPGGETPCTAMTDKLTELLMQESGLDFGEMGSFFFSSAPGKGGQPIENLMKGTVPYQRMLDHVSNTVRLCSAQGLTHAELAAVFMQGESDYSASTTRAVYLERLLQYRDDSAADKMAITGQQFEPLFLSYQLSAHKAYNKSVPVIALAQRDAALQGKSWLSAPGYIMDYNADHIHAVNYSYQMWAYYHGILIYKLLQDDLNDRERGMHRLDVINEFRQGVINDLLLNVPVKPVVFDTTWVTAAPNMGFDIRSVSNVLIDIISSVSIVGQDRIRIITTRPLADGEFISYGWGRTGDAAGNGRVSGPRGNVRDSQGDLNGYNYIDGAGTTRALHNWLNIIG
ncbi:hypothetical protein R3A00_000308 [Klebsiella oxytoca]|uniref:hypothetical protein n=1 Tax=Klebsiella oxytoca TaxID=571 RepID=UPI000BE44066|nr:hypothetical protein [Klebsiella oxytoca]EGT0046809.1 sialate O-acetylesterase [Klebsiella oxytoca]ELR0727002.1 hypothetical protein [Klebsiella oxytoca]PDO73943.1 hypothetical protein CPZ29_11220 [Klebsiella oxytoca]WDQ06523.1 hypothetical protein PVK22_03460 [Klebsiella oxytoca]HCD1069495.1 hypothetical protein [Klebsiella oxytoca]